MIKRWLRRAAEPGPSEAPPDEPPVQVPPDLLAWAQAVDVSRLSDRTVREAEDYLRKYRHVMNLEVSQEWGWRLMAVVEAQVSPPPPADAQPLDVLATVLAVRRRQLGIA